MYFASTKLLEVFVCSGIYYDSLCNLCYLMNNNNHNTMCVTTTSVYRFHSIYIYYYYSNIVFQLHFNTLAFNLTFFYVYLGSDSASFTNFYILCVVMTQVRKVSHHKSGFSMKWSWVWLKLIANAWKVFPKNVLGCDKNDRSPLYLFLCKSQVWNQKWETNFSFCKARTENLVLGESRKRDMVWIKKVLVLPPIRWSCRM